MILVIAASITVAAAGQPDTNSVWTRIPGGPGSGCAHDSSYAFFIHKGDNHRLAIFLNGGGACWNSMNCDLYARPTYHAQLDSTDMPDTQGGIFDLSNPRNPIRGYTIVFIPYCTGDVFLGGRTVSYTSTDTTGAAHEIQVRHQGRSDADQAVAWVEAHYPAPQLVFIAGSSAGAIPSPFYASQVARHYPKARIVQLGDGAGGYRAPRIPGILALWGATALLRSDSAYRDVDSVSLTFETIYEVSARTAPQVTFAQYNSAEDAVQLSFLALLGVRDVRLAGLLAANFADIRQINPALRTYTSPGPMHTILRRPEFYSLTVDGVAVRDWVADLLDGKHVSDVGQSLLATPTATFDSVARFVEAERTRQRIPGISIAILRGDSVVLARGFGYANVELQVPASDSTIYQSGSTGKQFTAAAVVMLAEQGKLSLDDPITRFLSEGPPSWRAITIRHLLTHTSGIPDYADSTMDWRKDYTEDQLVSIVAKKPPLFAPGERWSYSNTGYLLLGIIIHRASGVFYGDFLRDHVFRPLGMRTTRVISEADIVPNRAAGYQLVNDTLENQDWVSPSLNTTADGALYFTVRDLAQWAIGLNHERVPSPQGLATIWTPVRLNNGGTYPYGFGWEITQQRGLRRIGHSGSWQGFKAAIERYPDFKLTVIVLANLAEARQEAIAFGIAGIMEPRLMAAHLLSRALAAEPREPLDHLLHAITNRDNSAAITPALRAFIGDDTRADFAAATDSVRTWTPLGCDDVANRDIVQLGTRITSVCYSKGARPRSNLLMIGLYGADGRAANLDYYSF